MSNVPTWKRKLSSTEYLYKIYKLNEYIGGIVMKKSQKLRKLYGDHIVKTALEALAHAQIANRIYVDGEYTYNQRKSELLKVLGLIDNISTSSYLFLEKAKTNGTQPASKIEKEEYIIGDCCETISRLVHGVISSDKSRWNKSIK